MHGHFGPCWATPSEPLYRDGEIVRQYEYANGIEWNDERVDAPASMAFSSSVVSDYTWRQAIPSHWIP